MATICDWGIIEEKPTNPACKHGKHECLRCGTKSGKDRPHTTRGGKGVVATLVEEKKKRRR